jgi:hypothetical protein
MNTTIFSILVFILSSLSITAQSVFAPIVRAEWNYHFISDNYYETDFPFSQKKEGNLTIVYTKDTLIRSNNFKKFEQKWQYKYKGKDTLYTLSKTPFYMMQRNDSVFILLSDSLRLAFVYSTQVSSITKLMNINRLTKFSIELKTIRDTTPINNNQVILKKYSFKPFSTYVDVYFADPLIILDRIGPINSDITVITSEGESVNNVDIYDLVCYRDNVVGELKFSNRTCNLSVSVFDKFETGLEKDFHVLDDGSFINLSLPLESESINKVIIYDVSGKIIFINKNKSKGRELFIPKSLLPQGLLIINLSSDKSLYKAKKIIIHP